MAEHEETVARRPVPDAMAEVQAAAAKVNALIDDLRKGSIGIKPIPQLFPDWEIEIRLLLLSDAKAEK